MAIDRSVRAPVSPAIALPLRVHITHFVRRRPRRGVEGPAGSVRGRRLRHSSPRSFSWRVRLERSGSPTSLHQAKVQKAKDQRWWQYIRLGVDFLGIALPLGFYGIWMKRGFRFEETGSITSQTMRHLIKWFKPTR